MNRITRHISVPSLLLTVMLGMAIGYTALGQRAMAPAAPVIAVVRIDGLFENLQQRADARIDLLRLERDVEDEHRRRTTEITKLQTDEENAVAVTRRKELRDEIAIKSLQLRFWRSSGMVPAGGNG